MQRISALTAGLSRAWTATVLAARLAAHGGTLRLRSGQACEGARPHI